MNERMRVMKIKPFPFWLLNPQRNYPIARRAIRNRAHDITPEELELIKSAEAKRERNANQRAAKGEV